MNPRQPTPVKHCGHCGRRMERKRYGHALETLAKFANRRFCDPWCATQARSSTPEPRPLAAMRPRKRRRRATAKLNPSQIRAAYTLYEQGMSLYELAEHGWRQWGFASAESARVNLGQAFILEGLPARQRSEALLVCYRRQRWEKKAA